MRAVYNCVFWDGVFEVMFKCILIFVRKGDVNDVVSSVSFFLVLGNFWTFCRVCLVELAFWVWVPAQTWCQRCCVGHDAIFSYFFCGWIHTCSCWDLSWFSFFSRVWDRVFRAMFHGALMQLLWIGVMVVICKSMVAHFFDHFCASNARSGNLAQPTPSHVCLWWIH